MPKQEAAEMASKIPEIVAGSFSKIAAFDAALRSESERGCALFVTAYLDDSLYQLLCASLVASPKRDDDLFKGSAPLSSISSRIKMAYYLGLISTSCRRELDILRQVRNDFAHQIEVTFASESVRNRCQSLGYSHPDVMGNPRAQFTMSAIAVLGYIHGATLLCKQHTEQPDSADSLAEIRRSITGHY